jgi:hypothetical protein
MHPPESAGEATVPPAIPDVAARVRISSTFYEPFDCHDWGVTAGQTLPMQELRIRSLVLHKWSDYQPVLPLASLRFLDREAYLDAARADARIRDELVMGLFEDFEAEFREPVLADAEREVVTVCPPIMREIVEPEPPRIQRAYVEGALMRRMFRLLVEGTGWEADAQVRDVMARHFPFHLAAVEAVEAGA